VDVVGLLERAADKIGFKRERADIRKVPTDPSNICVVPFFGDLRSLFVLSSILLKRFRDEERGSKYFIVCTWPGFQAMFPYADEVWGIKDEQLVKKLYSSGAQFRNKGLVTAIYRNLNQFFEDVVILHEQFREYYDGGITDKFWIKYKHVRRFLPGIPSSAQLGKEFNREIATRGGFKVFIWPSTHLMTWRFGDIEQIPIKKDFWIALLKRMVAERYVPVVYKGLLTYDLSTDMLDKCIHVNEVDFGKVLSIMRVVGCVLDIFSGISRFAIVARCPFLAIDERARYVALREYEIDDLCCHTLPKQYIFSFPTIIDGGNSETWDFNIINNIMVRLNSYIPELDRNSWPATGEVNDIIPYDTVRKKKSKRIGVKLLKLPKN
jgi:hypothetical protein